ncbi:UdgX family uracil-DNA binding protein [Brucella pseudogrignonensis]
MSFSATIDEIGTLDSWRQTARRALSHRIAPECISWNAENGLFGSDPLPQSDGSHPSFASKAFLETMRTVIWHDDSDRFHLLYQALWRLVHHDGNPLSPVDPLGYRLTRMSKTVRRDLHKMHAFLRFREISSETQRRRFIAWFEPDHNIVEPASTFFVSRFSDMDWTILTPKRSASFESGVLQFQPGAAKPHLTPDDSEALWNAYFTNIFNPARTNIRAMLSEMPKKYWRNMPETKLIPAMLKDAEARTTKMREAQATIPRKGSQLIAQRYRDQFPVVAENAETIEDLNLAIRNCRRCSLCEQASQAVCGAGSRSVDMMIVGEQPGDQEDLSGQPFVGPAGQILRRLMQEANITDGSVFLTNAVKHFKFTPSGKRRLHQTPNRDEIEHCRWWLTQEIALVKPRLILALGASAAFALTQATVPMARRRGTEQQLTNGATLLFSWHPSYILRLSDPSQRQRAESELLADLNQARDLAAALARAA